MEELKLLVEMVASLPQMAIWVLVAFWCYKVVVIGSIFGIVRMAILKVHDWLTKPKVINYKVGGRAVNEDVLHALNEQINRISDSMYIHSTDVENLRKAIDAMKKP